MTQKDSVAAQGGLPHGGRQYLKGSPTSAGNERIRAVSVRSLSAKEEKPMILQSDAEKIRKLSADVDRQCGEFLSFMATPTRVRRIGLTRDLHPDECDRIAVKVTGFFSRSRFDEHFEGRITVEGWTIEQALAVWFSLAHLALVVAATKAYGSEQGAVSRVVRLCEPHLTKRWSMPMGVSIRFQSTVERTESEALAALSTCATGRDLATFEIRYTDRILGVQVPLSVRNKSNPLMDYLSTNAEPQAGLAISHYVGLLFMELVESLVPEF